MAICHTTDMTFQQDVHKEVVTLVNFWATWCGPCRMFGQVLETFDQEGTKDVRILKVNVDDCPETTAHFGIMSVPTTILFKTGKPISKVNGAISLESLKQYVAENK